MVTWLKKTIRIRWPKRKSEFRRCCFQSVLLKKSAFSYCSPHFFKWSNIKCVSYLVDLRRLMNKNQCFFAHKMWHGRTCSLRMLVSESWGSKHPQSLGFELYNIYIYFFIWWSYWDFNVFIFFTILIVFWIWAVSLFASGGWEVTASYGWLRTVYCWHLCLRFQHWTH